MNGPTPKAGWPTIYELMMKNKKFTWNQRADGSGAWTLKPCQPDLYQRDQVIAAQSVVVCAGERDCHMLNQWLRELGKNPAIVATCNHTGENSVKAESFRPLHGKQQVWVIGDNDKTGESYRDKVCGLLQGNVPTILPLWVPEDYNDVTEWAEAGGTAEDFKGLLDAATPFKGQESPGEHLPRENTSRRVELVRADTITPQRTDWVWEGRMPHRDIIVLCGDADVGKTMIALDRGARWTRGLCEGIFKDVPVDVLIASAEDSPAHTLIPRLKAAGADLTRFHIIKLKAGKDDAGGLSFA